MPPIIFFNKPRLYGWYAVGFLTSGVELGVKMKESTDCVGRNEAMAISYNGLWKNLIDKNLPRKDLRETLKISSSTFAKMTESK